MFLKHQYIGIIKREIIMKMYLTTILLCSAIILITIGIYTNNLIPVWIGGILAGVYNAMIYSKN